MVFDLQTNLASKHVAFAGEQPSFADIGEFVDDTFCYILRNSVITTLDLVEVLATRKTDVVCKKVCCHSRPFDHGVDSVPILVHICHCRKNVAYLHDGSVVQWIECKIPVLVMKVRILSGLQR